MHKCIICGMPMTVRYGKYGIFWGCKGFPKCRHTERHYLNKKSYEPQMGESIYGEEDGWLENSWIPNH